MINLKRVHFFIVHSFHQLVYAFIYFYKDKMRLCYGISITQYKVFDLITSSNYWSSSSYASNSSNAWNVNFNNGNTNNNNKTNSNYVRCVRGRE